MRRIKRYSLTGFLTIAFLAVYFVFAGILPNHILVLPALFLLIGLLNLPIFDFDFTFSPLNYFSGLFVLNIAIAPAFLYTEGSYLTFWIGQFNPYFWDYASFGFYLILACFFFFLLGVKSVLQSNRSLGGTLQCEVIEVSNRQFWLASLSASVLIFLGCAGLIIAAGSFVDLFSVLGVRERALDILEKPGVGRYLVWAPGIGIGLAIIFHLALNRFQLTSGKAAFLAWILFLGFSPFFLFSSGRGAFILPCLLLFSAYCSKYKRPTVPSIGLMFLFAPIFFGFFAIYRQSGDLLTDKALLQIFSYTLLDSFSRLDVVIAGLAGFHETSLSFDFGVTYLAGLFQWLPPWLVDLREFGGTAQLARAVYADPYWSEASGLATFYGLEAYLAFGLFGSLVMSLILGVIAGFLQLKFYKGGISSIFSVSLALQIPVLAAFQIGVAGMIWGVFFPFFCYRIFYIFFGTFCFPTRRRDLNEERV